MRIATWIQALLLLLATVFPPFYFSLPGGATSHAGFHFFFSPPTTTHFTLQPTQVWNIVGRIDLMLLAAEWIVILGGGYLVRQLLSFAATAKQTQSSASITQAVPTLAPPQAVFCFQWLKRTSLLAAISFLTAGVPVYLLSAASSSDSDSPSSQVSSEQVPPWNADEFKVGAQKSDQFRDPYTSEAQDRTFIHEATRSVATILVLIGSFSWLAAMYWLAATAAALGRSFLAWFLGQLLFWPVGFFLAYYRLNNFARTLNFQAASR